MKDLKKDGNKISFTTDAWSDTSAGVSPSSLTAHAINDSFEKENLVLSAQPLNERHTVEYLSETFDKMSEKWEIQPNDVHCVS